MCFITFLVNKQGLFKASHPILTILIFLIYYKKYENRASNLSFL